MLDEEIKRKEVLEDEVRQITDQIKVHQDEFKSLNEQNETFEHLVSMHVQNEQELQQNIQRMNKEIREKEEELVVLKENFAAALSEKDEELQNQNEAINSKEESVKTLLQKYEAIYQDKEALVQENEHLNQRLVSMETSLNEKTEEFDSISSNLRSKEESVKMLLDEADKLRSENISLIEEQKEMSKTLIEKEEEIANVNSNLRSKEETVKMFLDQVENLQQNEASLKSTLLERENKLDVLATDIKEKEEVQQRLKQEIEDTEVSYQNDLRELEELYSDLQKQFESVCSSESALQNILKAKEKELEEQNLRISDKQEEVDNLKLNLSSKEEALKLLYEKIQSNNEHDQIRGDVILEKDRELAQFRNRLLEKEKELLQINILKNELSSRLDNAENLIAKYSETDEKYHKLETSFHDKEAEVFQLQNDLNKSLRARDEELEMAVERKQEVEQQLHEKSDYIKSIESRMQVLMTENNEKDETINHLTVLKSEMHKNFENLKHAVNIKEEELFNKDQIIGDLRKQLSDASLLHTRMQQHLAEQDEKLFSLQTMYENMEKSKADVMSHYDNTIKTKDEEIQSLRHMTQVKDVELTTSISESENLSLALGKSYEQLESLRKQTEYLQSSASSEKLQLEQRVAEQEKRLKEQADSIASLNDLHVTMEVNITQMQEELETAREKQTEKDTLTNSLQDQLSNISNILAVKDTELNISRTQLDHAEKQISQLHEECQRLEDDIIIKNGSIEQLQATLETGKESSEKFNQILNGLRTLNDQKTSEIKKLTEDLQNQSSEKNIYIQQVEGVVRELEKERDSLKEEQKLKLEQEKCLIEQVNQYERKLAQLQHEYGEQIDQLIKEKNILVQENEDLSEIQENTQNTSKERTKHYEEHIRTLQEELTEKDKTIEELSRNVADKNCMIQGLEDNLKKQSRCTSDRDEEVTELKGILNDTMLRMEQLNDAVNEQEHTSVNLRDQLNEKHQEMTAAISELKNLKSENEILNSAVTETLAENYEANAIVKDKELEIFSLKEKMVELTAMLDELTSAAKIESNSEDELSHIKSMLDTKEKEISELEDFNTTLNSEIDMLKKKQNMGEAERSKLQADYDNLKKKMAQLVKKSQAFKGALKDKQQELSESISENKNLNRQLTELQYNFEKAQLVLQEQEISHQKMQTKCNSQETEILALQELCHQKDGQVEELKLELSQQPYIVTLPKHVQEEVINESYASTAASAAPSEASTTTTIQDLEWDPTNNNSAVFSNVESSSIQEHVQNEDIEQSVTECPTTAENDEIFPLMADVLETALENTVETAPSDQSILEEELRSELQRKKKEIEEWKEQSQLELKQKENMIDEKDMEIQKMKEKIDHQGEVLMKAKKKIALSRKTEIELAKEIKALKERPDAKILNANLNKTLTRVAGLEKLNSELAARNEQLVNLLKLMVEESEECDNIDALVDNVRLVKAHHEDEINSMNSSIELMGKVNQDLQHQFDSLQKEYQQKTSQCEMLEQDMESLINEKITFEELIQTLKEDLERIKEKRENSDNPVYTQKLKEIRDEFEREKQKHVEVLNLAREEYELVKNKAIAENRKLLEEQFENDRATLKRDLDAEHKQLLQDRNLLQQEKETFKEQLEYLKVEEMSDMKFKLKKEYSEIIKSLESRCNALAFEKENERLLKEQTVKENQLLQEEHKKLELNRMQQEDHEQLINDLHKTQHDYTTLAAQLEETESAFQCEKLLKEQYGKENEILKNEMQELKEKVGHQQDVSLQLEELRQHKDLVIKKLKLKLKQIITEKDKLNDSLGDMSTTVHDKDMQLIDLKSQIERQDMNMSNVTEESLRRIQEKEELVEALKDECSWLKESMVPLINKADQIDGLVKENEVVKFHLESKDSEISHLRENIMLKDNQILDLVEQEKAAREEFLSKNEKLLQFNEEKDHQIKHLKEQLHLVQSEIEELEPSVSQLNVTLEDLNQTKEELQEEIQVKESLESQIESLEESVTEKQILVDQLSDRCSSLEKQLSAADKGKADLYEATAKLEQLKSMYKSKEREMKTMKESLDLKQQQLQEARHDLLYKVKELEDSQGALQTKEVEIENLRAEIDGAKSLSKELEGRMKGENELLQEKDELLDKLEQLEAILQEKNQLIQEQEEEIFNVKSILDNERESHSVKQKRLLELQRTIDSERSKYEESISESNRTVDELRYLKSILQGKNDENEALVKQIEEIRSEYDDSIAHLHETINEKEALYEESVLQIQQVKEMLESQANSSTPHRLIPQIVSPLVYEAPLQAAESDQFYKGPDEGSWGDDIELPLTDALVKGEGTTPAIAQSLKTPVSNNDYAVQDVAIPMVAQNSEVSADNEKLPLDTLNEELNKLRQEKDEFEKVKLRKEEVIAKLKLKMKQFVDENKEKEESLTKLKDEMIQLEDVKSHKDTIIAKLKVKLKQTIQSRDQIKENLQSEVDRVANEKDIIFNEFAEKLQQQEQEMKDMQASNEMLTNAMTSIQEVVTSKEMQVKDLEKSFTEKSNAIDQISDEFEELQTKHLEIRKELDEKQDLVEKYEWELSEKEDITRQAETELRKYDDDRQEWQEVRNTLEEAMTLKDQALEKLNAQLDSLQKDYARLNVEKNRSENNAEDEVTQQRETISKLEGELHQLKVEKDKVAMKNDELVSQYEGIEILFGISEGQDSLIEQLGLWKNDMQEKLRDAQRELIEKEIISGQIQQKLGALERLSNLTSLEQQPISERLDLLKTAIVDRNRKLHSGIDVPENNETSKPELSEIEKELQLKEEELKDKTADYVDVIEENQELKEEVEDLKERIKELNIVERKSKEHEAKLKEIEHTNAMYVSELEDREKKLKELNQEVQRLIERNSVSENEVLKYQQEVKDKAMVIEELREKNTEKESLLAAMKLDRDKILEEKEKMDKDIFMYTVCRFLYLLLIIFYCFLRKEVHFEALCGYWYSIDHMHLVRDFVLKFLLDLWSSNVNRNVKIFADSQQLTHFMPRVSSILPENMLTQKIS